MKTSFQSVHFTADEKLISFIENRLTKLDRIFEGIIDAQVILKLENSGQVKDKIAEIIISIPGNKLVANSKSKSFEQATDESVDALSRQLKKVKGKKRDTQKGSR